MMRRMRKGTTAIVHSMMREIIGSEKIHAVTVNDIVTVLPNFYALIPKVYSSRTERRVLPSHRNSEMKSASNNGSLSDSWEVRMKSVRQGEGLGQCKIERPTTIKRQCLALALRRHKPSVPSARISFARRENSCGST